MRALWSRKNDEDVERYRARTVDRLRGLTSSDVDDRSPAPSEFRARVERLMAETQPEPQQQSGTV